MNWSLSEYNLIVYGNPKLEIFKKQNGSSRFEAGRLFEYTSSHLKTRYEENVGRLSELPTLIAAEIRDVQESPSHAFLSSIDRVRKNGNYISFQFNHVHRISSEEIFESDYFDIEWFERHRTHWAIKEGHLLDFILKLVHTSQADNHGTGALMEILDDLEKFRIDVNQYLSDPEPQYLSDSVLTGMINSLLAYCQTLGWSKLTTRLEQMTPLRGNAIESLQFIQTFVVPQARTLLAKPDFEEGPQPTDWFWKFVHPRVAQLARQRFEAGNNGDAVESVFKEINQVVKRIVKKLKAPELDGHGLMTTALSANNPLIKLTELETKTDHDIQQGYMEIMAGAMTGIRNPKAHGNLNPPSSEALHLISLASLLMHKIDERKSPK